MPPPLNFRNNNFSKNVHIRFFFLFLSFVSTCYTTQLLAINESKNLTSTLLIVNRSNLVGCTSNGGGDADSNKHDGVSPKYTDEQRILQSIFAPDRYDPGLIPVRHHNMTIHVFVGLTITQIFDVKEKDQILITSVWLEMQWNDQYIRWNPANYSGVMTLRVPSLLVWIPDVMLWNTAADFQKPVTDIRAMISYDGTVFYSSPGKLVSFCHIENTFFPFDIQTCFLKFGSWTYDGRKLDVFNKSHEIDLSNFIQNGEWELVQTNIKKTTKKYSCCPEVYIDLNFGIRIKRRSLYYMVNIFHPCFAVSLFCFMVFFLPPESGEKCAFGITVMLTASVLIFNIADKLPKTSESVPLISIYLSSILATACAAVIFTVLVMHLHLKQRTLQRLRPPPEQVQWLMDKIFTVPWLAFACGYCNNTQLDEQPLENAFSSQLVSITARPYSYCYEEVQDYYQNLKTLSEQRQLISSLKKIVRQWRQEAENKAVLEKWQLLAQLVDKFLLCFFTLATCCLALALLIVPPEAPHDGDEDW